MLANCPRVHELNSTASRLRNGDLCLENEINLCFTCLSVHSVDGVAQSRAADATHGAQKRLR